MPLTYWNGSTRATGRCTTKVVAAYSSGDTVKEQADYVGDYTADNVQIQEAIDAIPSGGGEVHLAAGIYSIAASIVLPHDIVLSGEGVGTKLQLASGANVDLLTTAVDTSYSNIQIKNLQLAGDRDNNTSGSAIYGRFSRLKVRNLYITDFDDDGIKIHASSTGATWITDTGIFNCDGYGINIGGGGDYYLSDLDIGDGTEVMKSCIYGKCSAVSLINSQLWSCDESAIVIGGNQWTIDSVMLGGGIGQHGILMDTAVAGGWLAHHIIGNIIAWDVSKDGTGTYSVIAINTASGNGANGIWMHHIDYTGYNYNAKYFVELTGTANVSSCKLDHSGVTDSAFLDTGLVSDFTKVLVDHSLGWLSENSGTATVANGQTTVVVTHGLATTPARVYVTPTLLSNAASFWVTNKTSTQFTINVNADPGAGTATFDWMATVSEGN